MPGDRGAWPPTDREDGLEAVEAASGAPWGSPSAGLCIHTAAPLGRAHLDAEEQGHAADGEEEEQQEEQEPGAPVQPAAEPHHAHVLLGEDTWWRAT